MHIEFVTGAILTVCAIVFVLANFWDVPRRRRRRNSLHQDAAGYWVWTEFDGREVKSFTHPDAPGGEWHAELGLGGGDGSDGGSDGGGFGGGGGGGD